MTIENAEALVPLRPAARFRIVSCGCAPKVGSFEYSAALPRAESAEAAGSFRDQGLTGRRPLAARRTAGLAAADDATSGISGRITCIVVLAGVDHDRSAAGMKNRVGLILVAGDRGVEHFEIEGAACRNVQVRHVAGVSRTRHHAVARIGRIEMPAC